jgi:alginate O-acetyltransferase complex protein AlgI
VITSPLFWTALLVAGLLSWRVPRRRDLIVIIGSAAFIGWSDWRSLVAVLVLGSAAYLVARAGLRAPRWSAVLFIAVTIAFLAAFKYLPPLREAWLGGPKGPATAPVAAAANAANAANAVNGITVVVPLGASYFTFKLIHYVVEARRGQLPRHDYKTLLGWLLFLPMFTAGPIERFDDYLAGRSPGPSRAHFAEGGSRVLYGLIKKMVVVDILLNKHTDEIPARLSGAIPFWNPPCTADGLLKHLDTVRAPFVWQFVVHQFAAWYLDFSAYSDVAIGVALFFGVRLTENFDWPLLAPTPTAFWKRYHATLSAFCQRYVYLPVMGWSRSPYLALYATMMTMGLWHAGNLNYVVWGAYHATILSFHLTLGRIKRWRKWKPSRPFVVLGTLVTALSASASAVFPATSAHGIGAALKLLASLFSIHFRPLV